MWLCSSSTFGCFYLHKISELKTELSQKAFFFQREGSETVWIKLYLSEPVENLLIIVFSFRLYIAELKADSNLQKKYILCEKSFS